MCCIRRARSEIRPGKDPMSIIGAHREEEGIFLKDWEQRGLWPRCARSLLSSGILTLDHLREATNHQLSVLPGVGPRGLSQICELVGRKPPGRAKMPEAV